MTFKIDEIWRFWLNERRIPPPPRAASLNCTAAFTPNSPASLANKLLKKMEEIRPT